MEMHNETDRNNVWMVTEQQVNNANTTIVN